MLLRDIVLLHHTDLSTSRVHFVCVSGNPFHTSDWAEAKLGANVAQSHTLVGWFIVSLVASQGYSESLLRMLRGCLSLVLSKRRGVSNCSRSIIEYSGDEDTVILDPQPL